MTRLTVSTPGRAKAARRVQARSNRLSTLPLDENRVGGQTVLGVAALSGPRHRYEVNNAYREQLEAVGMHFSGLSPDGRLVEFAELDHELHPFFVGTQAHPEFMSRPTRPYPLFAALVRAALTAPSPCVFRWTSSRPTDRVSDDANEGGTGRNPVKILRRCAARRSMIRQYRHPVRRYLWEVPAGINVLRHSRRFERGGDGVSGPRTERGCPLA